MPISHDCVASRVAPRKKPLWHRLHHPQSRDYFAANLQKDIPRLPLANDFRKCAEIGGELTDLHIGYESVKRYELK